MTDEQYEWAKTEYERKKPGKNFSSMPLWEMNIWLERMIEEKSQMILNTTIHPTTD